VNENSESSIVDNVGNSENSQMQRGIDGLPRYKGKIGVRNRRIEY
jgi:hypothetical protein